MALAIRIVPETLRSIAAASIPASYTLAHTVGGPFLHPIRMFVLQNFTDQTVMFSFDGVNDHLPLASSAYIIMDVTSNKTVESGAFFAQGTTLYCRYPGTEPTTGSVYLSVFYGTGPS
jgi:hypothetical protein